MRIGTFEAAKRELAGEKDDFVFCGESFTVEQSMPAVLQLQLGAAISGKVGEEEGFAAIWEALRISLTVPEFYRLAATDEYDDADVKDDADGNKLKLVPADDSAFRKLYKLAVDNGVELDELMRLVMALFEAQTGRPTRSAPASSDGPPNILTSSSDSSTPAARSHLRRVEDIINGEESAAPASNVIQLGDGTMVEVEYNDPTARIG